MSSRIYFGISFSNLFLNQGSSDMKKILLVLVISANILTAQNYMWPLAKGNEYQYFEYGTHQVGYSYALDSEMVIKDTIINQLKYYSFNTSGDFFRYDQD